MKTWICDIDGTLALMNGRGPFDWSRVGEDLPNEPVISVVKSFISSDYHIVYMSGRMEEARKQTELWLDVNVHGKYRGFPLFMRADGDYRPDMVVKKELYENHILGNYDVAGVIDDRDQVVKMWRDLGLTCFQVAEGNFLWMVMFSRNS